MKKLVTSILSSTLLFIAIFLVAASPVFVLVHAQTGQTSNETIGIPCDEINVKCDFAKLVQLASNVITFLLLLSIPVATVSIAWAGWMILSAGGNTGKIEEGKEIFKKVVIGFFFALTAWLIVKLITGALLRDDGFQNLLTQAQADTRFDTQKTGAVEVLSVTIYSTNSTLN